MSRLVLTYEGSEIKEVLIGSGPVTIGRAPDNDILIDNLAVSNYHARVFQDGESLVIEDLNSLNGSYLNDIRVQRAGIKDGDSILVGKHRILVDYAHDAALASDARMKSLAPRVNETMVLDTNDRQKLLEQVAALGEAKKESAGRLRVPTLTVLRGRTDQKEYRLAGKLTVIGRSDMATVRLGGWFTPNIAAQINKHEDGYYLGRGDRIPKINGVTVTGMKKLNDGDLIEIGRVRISFGYPE